VSAAGAHPLLISCASKPGSQRGANGRIRNADKRLPFCFTTIVIETGCSSQHGVPSMCDYSLELVASRPAKVGDKLVSTGFPRTSTRGFASVDDSNVAVCLLPGTELGFEDEVRCETGFVLYRSLGHRVARFRQINKGQSNLHRDALEFPDGKIVLLTHLCTGQRATVLQLPASAPVKVEVRQRHGALVV
jgi:hypothetical protein